MRSPSYADIITALTVGFDLDISWCGETFARQLVRPMLTKGKLESLESSVESDWK
jgi:hypothetical protein